MLGRTSDLFLGITHLVADFWAVALVTAGLRYLLGAPIWLGVLLNLMWLVVGVPLAMLFMRGPV